MNRIIIKELILAGKGKQDAVLSFKQGMSLLVILIQVKHLFFNALIMLLGRVIGRNP